MTFEKFESPVDAGRVKDVDKAWAGALSEKPIRDLAREEGVSEEEKAILDRLALRRGEKALQEYEAEKNKDPYERLTSAIEKISASMKEKGLSKDAEIMDRLKARLGRYVAFFASEIKKFEKENNIKASYEEMPDSVSVAIFVVNRIGKDGEGRLLLPGGRRRGASGEPELYTEETASSAKERLKAVEGETEFMNYGFTDKGNTEFLRAVGVLGQSEEYLDLPKILEKAGKKNVDPNNFHGTFPTVIDDLQVKVSRTPESHWRKDEEAIVLLFKKPFIDQLISRQRK